MRRRAAPATTPRITYPTYTGYAVPNPRAEDDRRRDHPAARPAERQARQADADQHQARHEDAPVAEAIAEPAGERPCQSITIASVVR